MADACRNGDGPRAAEAPAWTGGAWAPRTWRGGRPLDRSRHVGAFSASGTLPRAGALREAYGVMEPPGARG